MEVPRGQIVSFQFSEGRGVVVTYHQTDEFVRLLGKYQQRIYAFILTLAADWNDADEVLQETNVVLWRKFSEFKPDSDFVRWACQVAYFEVLKHRKRQKQDRLVFSEQFLEAVSADSIAMADELDVQRQALAACRDKLPPHDRDLLDRRYRSGATTQSVAIDLGRSVEAVYKAVQRIRVKLQNCVRRALAEGDR